jgi:hypothetical protein
MDDGPQYPPGELSDDVRENRPDLEIEDTSFFLSRSPCYGPCPVYSVEICGDGTVHYIGYRFVDKAGKHTYQIPKSNVTWLINRAHDIEYFSLQSSYTRTATDGGSTTTEVRFGTENHTVFNPTPSDGPERLRTFELELREKSGVASLIEGGNNELSDERAEELEEQQPFCS